MKIAVTQTKPVTGNIRQNIKNHKRLVDLGVRRGAELIFFPELSLTGYEPRLAKELAIDPDDHRLDGFQDFSNGKQITIGVGAPTKSAAGTCISMLLFQPVQARQLYSKQHLHADELPFFVCGRDSPGIIGAEPKIALAICYEISVLEHAELASRNGAKIYVASVAKFVRGIDKAVSRLAEIAGTHSMTVLMSNCIGECDGSECAGKSSVWNDQGGLVGQLDDSSEGILIFDTATQSVMKELI
jgi:predicted amidohydrolase